MLKLAAAVALCFIAVSKSCRHTLTKHGPFDLLQINGCPSYRDVGVLVGSTFRDMIKDRVKANKALPIIKVPKTKVQ